MISINGNVFAGSRIVIGNNNIVIDGVSALENLSGIVEIKIDGDVLIEKCNASMTVNGNILGGVAVGGSLSCGNITGSASAGGSIKCLDVGGNISAGGGVVCKR